MTSFETEVYNRSEDNVIGARVIVSADNGQTIDSIQVTNKTQFDELKNKLNTLNEDYIQFDEDSPLAGKSIDDILANTVEDAIINATKLGGFASDSFAKAGHKHVKSEITDLYNYDISCSKYNLNLGSLDNSDKQATVTVKVTNTNNSPVNNHQVLIYKNGSLWKTGRTNSNGQYTATYTAETQGLVTFQVNNQKIQCNVNYDTGWVNCSITLALWANESNIQARRIGNVVHVRGSVRTAQNGWYIADWTDYWNLADLPDSRFKPPFDETFVMQSSKKQRCTVQLTKTDSAPNGFLRVGRFTDANSSGYYVLPKDLWIPVALTYFVD